jgi:hypothetical protein
MYQSGGGMYGSGSRADGSGKRMMLDVDVRDAPDMETLLELCRNETTTVFIRERVAQMYQRLKHLLTARDTSKLSNTPYGRKAAEEIINLLQERMVAHVSELGPRHICMMLGAHSAMNFKLQAPLMHVIKEQIRAGVHDFDERGITNCLYAFARLRQHPGMQVWLSLCHRGCELIRDFNSQVGNHITARCHTRPEMLRIRNSCFSVHIEMFVRVLNCSFDSQW